MKTLLICLVGILGIVAGIEGALIFVQGMLREDVYEWTAGLVAMGTGSVLLTVAMFGRW